MSDRWWNAAFNVAFGPYPRWVRRYASWLLDMDAKLRDRLGR